MPTAPTSAALTTTGRRGTLDDFLEAGDIAPVVPLADGEWNRIRRTAGWLLSWRFCTARNLVTHRGNFARDAMGFAWGGIYRTLFVSSIVTTSYRNEGHFRSGDRIRGTADFFSGSFVLPKTAEGFRELVRMVNLRHHVAGVVRSEAGDRVAVLEGYEADYAYVATAFIESIRRGLALCGLPADSGQGRDLGWRVARILYQIAGFTGLARMPRDLAAHERLRDAFDRHLLEQPPSPRVRRMAQEIARRIIPATAHMAGETVAGHVRRHLDPDTQAYLFPAGEIPAELENERLAWRRRIAGEESLAAIERRSRTRRTISRRPDVAALERAYRHAASDNTDDRLIGAVLLHAIDSGRSSGGRSTWPRASRSSCRAARSARCTSCSRRRRRSWCFMPPRPRGSRGRSPHSRRRRCSARSECGDRSRPSRPCSPGCRTASTCS